MPSGCCASCGRTGSPSRRTPTVVPAAPTTAPWWRCARTWSGSLGSPRTALPGRSGRARAVCHRRVRPRDHGVVGDHDRRLGRDGLRPDDRLLRAPVRRDEDPAPSRVAVRQRLRLDRQGDSADGRRARPTAAVHPGAFAAEQRHRGGVREDAQAGLCPLGNLGRHYHQI